MLAFVHPLRRETTFSAMERDLSFICMSWSPSGEIDHRALWYGA